MVQTVGTAHVAAWIRIPRESQADYERVAEGLHQLLLTPDVGPLTLTPDLPPLDNLESDRLTGWGSHQKDGTEPADAQVAHKI